jgi:hypothetical protein
MEYAVYPETSVRNWRSVRGAARYPLHLQVALMVEGRQLDAVTEDVSASGALFRLEEDLPEGARVEFLLEIPQGAVDSGATAAVHCAGHIVRSYQKRGQAFAAAVIDEYRFQ